MDRTEVLLLAVLAALLARIAQAHFQHKALLELLNHWATMSGEVFPFLRQLTGKDRRGE